MNRTKGVKNPFTFYFRQNLLELTGRQARNAEELLEGIKRTPETVIYYHTHHYLQQHQYLSPEPPNDFAYWVSEVLGDHVLGESLASVDLCQFSSIESLRQALIACFDDRNVDSGAGFRVAPPDHAFRFIKAVTFVLPTGYAAHNLVDFLEILRQVTIYSLYFHIFEARLRLGKTTNDFSFWLETSLGEEELAQEIAQLDPYTHTMEGLRGRVCELLERRLKNQHA